jgi:hypothetical protein
MSASIIAAAIARIYAKIIDNVNTVDRAQILDAP